MTGAGKTHTMMGDIYHTTTEEEGICTMAIDSIFSRIENDTEKDFKVKMSYLEIYNEQVNDLLCSSIPRTSNLGLMIVDDPIKGVIVQELAEFKVSNSKELIELVLKGNSKRTMAATRVNQFSSRSHAILQIMIEFKSKTRNCVEQVSTSKLCLVDLAGSERAASSENRGIRMREGGKINRSLLALGNCINILSDRTKAGSSFVPYRDSKLTRLLKDSFGGNTKTVMIACVNPSASAFEETVNTLKYAERAKRIKKRVTCNVKDVEVNIAKYSEIIAGLRSEITSLKEKLNNNPGQQGVTVIANPIEAIIPTFSLSSSPSQKIADKDIETIDEEIKKTKELKHKYQETLTTKSEEKILPLSHPSSLEDDEYLSKLSQELITKYEENYEMKESIHELKNLGEENNFSLKKLEEELQLLQCQKELALNFIGQRRYDPLIEKKKEEIAQLITINEGNEVIQKDLQKSLEDNNSIQQKYLSLVVKLQSYKKKDILELQITVRILSLEKLDLLMQNLEMKKNAHISRKVEEERTKEMTQMKQELEKVKEQLQLKDQQLQLSKTQIQKQSKELQNLKQQYSQKGQKNRGNANSEAPKERKSDPNIIRLSFRKSTERKKFGTMKIDKHPFNEFKLSNNKFSAPFETLRPSPVDNSHKNEKKKVIFGITTKRIKPRYKDLTEKGEGSSVSVSSVSINANEISNSDIEASDSCVKPLNKKKSFSAVSRHPQAKLTHVKMEQKNIIPLIETDQFGTPHSNKLDSTNMRANALKPMSTSKKNILNSEKMSNYPPVESIKLYKNQGNIKPTIAEKKTPINRKNNSYKEIKIVLHSGGQARVFKDRRESVQEKIPILNSKMGSENKSKGFFSNPSTNHGKTLNQLPKNWSPESHLSEAPKPPNVQSNNSNKITRSLSLRESKTNADQVNLRINTKNRNPSVECFNYFNIRPQYRTPGVAKVYRADPANLKSTGIKRNFAIPAVLIPADTLSLEEAASFPSVLTEEELLKIASSMKQSADKKTRLNQEIDELIQQQKQSLKKDFLKAREAEECFKMAPSLNLNPLLPAMYPGDVDELLNWDFQ